MPDVEIAETGAQAAMAMLEGMGARALDMRPAFSKTTDALIVAERERFDRLGHPKEATREAKLRDGDPRVRANADRSGIAAGDLQRFLTRRGADAQPAKLTADTLVFGVPGGHRLAPRAAHLARIGKNPLVKPAFAGRVASDVITGHLMPS